ncbi:MAG: nicotinate-nucleotide adenylyltransferase [Alphaproteobacteria bacterium]|nr:nicotinate-nucleotide adenylyltransferase [Alphaproteobacteria bacterium]
MTRAPGPIAPRLRIGLLGGSFNPAHEGHRYISLLALRRLRLDAVWWLVSPQNPLKAETGMAALGERLAQARRIAHHPRIAVSAIEAELGTNYTIDTVRALKRRFPTLRFVWLMGGDNLIGFTRWKNWQRLARELPIAVIARPGAAREARASRAAAHLRRFAIPAEYAATLAMHAPPAWVFLEERLHRASSTAIRASGVWP